MENYRVEKPTDFNLADLNLKGVKIYEVGTEVSAIPSYNRRDFFKVCMNTGKNRIHYANKGIETNGPILFFGNPHIPYSWEIISREYDGYACVFTEEFICADRNESIQDSPFFKIGGTPIFNINEEQRIFLTSIFKKMIEEQNSDYVYKAQLIRSSINMIVHEAMKMEPNEHYFKHQNASSRITSLFFELLERQFPIESPNAPLQLKTPQEFAYNLSVHVNHLNRSVKEVTGKTTSVHITERIVTEAKALLLHTDWSVGDIAYALGFEYATYFNNYFKKSAGETPKVFRSSAV